MRKLLIALSCFPAVVFATETGESCGKIEDSAKRLECYDSLFIKKESKADEVNTEKTSWGYAEKKDELRNATAYSATLVSNNTVDFGFPYDNSSMFLTLRKDPKFGNDVIFDVDGQFNSCLIKGCQINVKFDDNKIESYRMVGSAGGGSGTIFIENQKSIKNFVDKLKKSKKLIVEASFYNHGKGQFTFDTQGLKWEHF